MPRKMGVLFFMVGSSCIRIVLPDLPAAEKGNKKSSKLCGDSRLITSKTPRLPQEAEVAISSDSPPQIVPFATVGQLLVCPPRPSSLCGGDRLRRLPFSRACPARHWFRVLLARRASIFWFLSWYWIFFLLSRGKSVLFARNPLKAKNFPCNPHVSLGCATLEHRFCQENFAKHLDKNTWQCYAKHTK